VRLLHSYLFGAIATEPLPNNGHYIVTYFAGDAKQRYYILNYKDNYFETVIHSRLPLTVAEIWENLFRELPAMSDVKR
jgi:hypothetical protein